MTKKKRPISSMTGFARQEGGDGVLTWSWELKSVNGRNLDMRCRVPSGYEELEPVVRARVPKVLARGNLQVNLWVNRVELEPEVRVNRQVLDQIVAVAEELQEAYGIAPPTADGLLALRGVVEEVRPEEDDEILKSRREAMASDFESALAALAAVRKSEGTQLRAIIVERLEAIEDLASAACRTEATQPENLRARLQGQIEELLQAVPALSEERLTQESALLVAKSDVREELDRLRAHCVAARDLLTEGGALGRRLDFLCQEFNRETNTICSKSSDIELTRIGLDLKSAIEQLREQIQNIE